MVELEMKRSNAIAWMSICSLLLSGCGYSEDVSTIYVLTPASKTSQFSEDLGKIAARHGLELNFGRAVSNQVPTSYVLEATGEFLRLWSTNMPLDPSACGHHEYDPGQYVVTLDHNLMTGRLIRILPEEWRKKPHELLSAMGKELKQVGYDVRLEAVKCSPALQEQLGQT